MNLNINGGDINAFCIHIKGRKDREVNMYKELDFFCGSNYEIIDAIKYPIGKIGVSRSFKKIIKIAKERNLKQILIFEDDVKFTSVESKKRFQECIDTLPDDWDVLLGGIYYHDNMYDYNEYMKTVDIFSALHCTLINNTMYDYILSHIEDSYNTIELDRYFGMLSKNGEINVYVSYPMIAIQYTGKSDTVKRNVDYSYILKNYDILY